MSSESTQADALREFDVVALLHELPEHRLAAGQVGTVLWVHEAGNELEVEFVEPSREPTLVRLHRSDLLKLHGLWVGGA